MPAATKTRSLVDQELTTRLRLAVGRLARRLRQQADPDVTPSMLSALSNIEYRQPVTLGELAQAERVTPPTMTKIVSRLEERGLVVRVADPSDRRVHRISLSTEGERFAARSKRRKNAYLAKMLRKLDADEVAKL